MQKNQIIVVFCHSRAALLEKCLDSINSANKRQQWQLVLVHQKGNKVIQKVIHKNLSTIDILVTVKPNFDFPLGNINYNRVFGTSLCFDQLGADYLLAIEEDNLISKDALSFISFACEKYKDNKSFRGINLGSIEFGSTISKHGYSLLRSGLHGSAGVITKQTWNTIKKKQLFKFDLNNRQIAWDSQIEFYLKTGFMVTPNRSRNLDLGAGGTFAPKSITDPYFQKITRSWYESKSSTEITYRRIQIKHSWRKDVIEFKRIHNIIYKLRTYNLITVAMRKLSLTNLIKKIISYI
jgi:hypothetical protein